MLYKVSTLLTLSLNVDTPPAHTAIYTHSTLIVFSLVKHTHTHTPLAQQSVHLPSIMFGFIHGKSCKIQTGEGTSCRV